MTREARRAAAARIVEQLRDHFGADLLALGLYGSVATGADAPYSDIEMHGILRGADIETSLEWSTGPWKAEVSLYSADRALRAAAELDGTWPLTHGAFVNVFPLDDPSDVFSDLRRAALQHDDDDFQRVIHDLAVGELYELVAKLRNLRARGGGPALPMFATELGKYAACLVGLINRHVYRSASAMLTESLQLAVRPTGYDALCAIVSEGRLDDIERVCAAADAFWQGVEEWSESAGLVLYEELADLLRRERTRRDR